MQIESLHLRETNFASKWLFTDSFTAGFKEKCRQFSPLWKYIFVEGGERNFSRFPFPFEIDRREYLKISKGDVQSEYQKFVRKEII